MPLLPDPAFVGRARGLRAFALVAGVLSLAAAPRAHALEIELGAPHVRVDSVWVDVRLVDPVASRIEESLARGMPATLQLHAELWRRRRA